MSFPLHVAWRQEVEVYRTALNTGRLRLKRHVEAQKTDDMSAELVTKVRDAEHWGQVRDLTDKKLLVVDVHKDWCGPCKIMEPTYKRLMTEIDHSDQRLIFASLNSGLSLEGVEDNESCKPRFLLYRDKKQIAEVAGANAPQLENLIKQNVPPISNDDEES